MKSTTAWPQPNQMLARGLRSSSQKAKSQIRLRKSPSRCSWHLASYPAPVFFRRATSRARHHSPLVPREMRLASILPGALLKHGAALLACPIAADHVVSRPLLRFGGAFDVGPERGCRREAPLTAMPRPACSRFSLARLKNGASDSSVDLPAAGFTSRCTLRSALVSHAERGYRCDRSDDLICKRPKKPSPVNA